MIVVLKHGIDDKGKASIREFLESKGCRVREIVGEEETIFGAVGAINFDMREVEIFPGVARVIPISKPYKLASRELKKDDTIVPVGPIKIGGARIAVIAGPCAVESREQIMEVAQVVRDSGAVILRGGAYKPRTSPYSFQGLGEEGLRYLKEAGQKMGMPVVTEIVSPQHVQMIGEYSDVFQIGARNMQNFELLKTVGTLGKPILLKRGLAATIEDLLMSAEYLLAHGAENVILCERGIRTFETYTRNTLDLSAIPIVKNLCHLPIIVDPSHGTGIRQKVLPMSLAAVAAGADGLIVEVHPDPESALSDGPQSLYPEQFEKLMRDIEALAPVLEKEVTRLPTRRPLGEIAVSRAGTAADEEIRVAFQGERGAFSEKAINRYFDENVRPVSSQSFRDVFKAVLDGEAEYGAVPLENSLSGSIHENYDLLLRFPDLEIVGEKTIRIIHNLITLPDTSMEDIKRVYSHPQGFAQCVQFLEGYPKWEKIPYYDTAGSVAFIAKEGKKENAAIASAEAARVYRMSILKESIETNAHNYTRFVIIARERHSAESGTDKHFDKASLVFSTLDKPGSLYMALKVLADRHLNMKKLESRPIEGKPWEYMFYVDVEIPNDIALFNEAVEELKKTTDDLRVLGIYKT
jgi:3-deoxy-7-phosphoheptulonate synthase